MFGLDILFLFLMFIIWVIFIMYDIELFGGSGGCVMYELFVLVNFVGFGFFVFIII